MAPYGSDSDSNSDNEEDERMKQLLASWDEDNGDCTGCYPGFRVRNGNCKPKDPYCLKEGDE